MINLTSPKNSLNKKWGPDHKILALLAIVILIIAGVLALGLWLGKKSAAPQKEGIPTTPPETTEEILKQGDVGELPSSEQPSQPSSNTPELPPVIFNTTGKITEVQKDRLMVEGSGSNFADQKPREIIVIFTASTLTFEPGQKVKYQGLEGLKHLKTGVEISIGGEENLRGKTEFIARTINISES